MKSTCGNSPYAYSIGSTQQLSSHYALPDTLSATHPLYNMPLHPKRTIGSVGYGLSISLPHLFSFSTLLFACIGLSTVTRSPDGTTTSPLTRKQWRSIFDTTKVDVLLLSPKPVYDIGHNSLAAFTYFGVFVLFIIQTVTGLAMFCVSTNNVMEPFFTWVLLKCGGFFVVRQIHHIAMWAFILFTIAHIYLVFYHDYIERNGIASSIIGGWKFVREDLAEEYETEQKQQQQLQKQKDGIANETTEK